MRNPVLALFGALLAMLAVSASAEAKVAQACLPTIQVKAGVTRDICTWRGSQGQLVRRSTSDTIVLEAFGVKTIHVTAKLVRYLGGGRKRTRFTSSIQVIVTTPPAQTTPQTEVTPPVTTPPAKNCTMQFPQPWCGDGSPVCTDEPTGLSGPCTEDEYLSMQVCQISKGLWTRDGGVWHCILTGDGAYPPLPVPPGCTASPCKGDPVPPYDGDCQDSLSKELYACSRKEWDAMLECRNRDQPPAYAWTVPAPGKGVDPNREIRGICMLLTKY